LSEIVWYADEDVEFARGAMSEIRFFCARSESQLGRELQVFRSAVDNRDERDLLDSLTNIGQLLRGFGEFPFPYPPFVTFHFFEPLEEILEDVNPDDFDIRYVILRQH
jgi:hypothetical protein